MSLKKTLHQYCCRSRSDTRIFCWIYLLILIILFIILMVAFLRQSSIRRDYLRWYNDSCTSDWSSSSSMIECDHSLRLFCQPIIQRCVCRENMFWNNSFCDCGTGMYWIDEHCQERLTFGQRCQSTQTNSCSEYLTCSLNTSTCDCPSNSYYNQSACYPKLTYNATQSCILSSQCVDGLICSANVCTCPTFQQWNGNTCVNPSTNGQFCLNTFQCDTSARLICNNTYFRCTCDPNSYWDGEICRLRLNNGSLCNHSQQCLSELLCHNNYCQCPLLHTQYWSSQSSTCELCFGENLFLFEGICYHIPLPTNTTLANYSILASNYVLSTIQYNSQFEYLFIQHRRVFNWIPIYFSTNNPIRNHFHWSPTNTLINPTYFCNETIRSNFTGWILSFKLETNTPCLRAWSMTVNGQLIEQLNQYVDHIR